MKYVIEHLDPEVFDWCFVEYTHISQIVGKENLLFTNIKNSAEIKKLETIGTVEEKSIKKIQLNRMCILDPEAKKTLAPEDAKLFDSLVFGGILGNWPPEKRTQKELSSKIICETRNLGKEQMSTNTAVYVAKKIMDGKKFSEFTFIEELTIPIEDGEEIILPFRFVVENEKPVLAKDYIEFVKKSELF
ncbi:MAG: SAM-dependent methyltransferase [Candidatus Woesearchaeota archaeon]|jgi:ribosome biogenesis SPOUT family RNA methylase Rps3